MIAEAILHELHPDDAPQPAAGHPSHSYAPRTTGPRSPRYRPLPPDPPYDAFLIKVREGVPTRHFATQGKETPDASRQEAEAQC